jgi:hypothetical protein
VSRLSPKIKQIGLKKKQKTRRPVYLACKRSSEPLIARNGAKKYKRGKKTTKNAKAAVPRLQTQLRNRAKTLFCFEGEKSKKREDGRTSPASSGGKNLLLS